jgi:hypothetical protein
VSPDTQYAVGSAVMIGKRIALRDTGMRRNICRVADSSVSFPSISLETSSGMSA